jgi:hypothetical protein
MSTSQPSMTTRLRRLAHILAPEILNWRRSYYLRRGVRNSFGAFQSFFRRRVYPGNASPVVLSGPFQGMRYLDETVWGPITPKWVGTYELELLDIVEAIVRRGYARIVNIGCAEGYYATGLARRDGSAEIFAFDTDPLSRMQTRRLANRNGVGGRVHVEGKCQYDRLSALVKSKTLLIVDIEGYEIDLLDPAKVPNLAQTDMLIEVHEDTEFTKLATAEKQLTDRFADSHVIERRVSTGRDSWIEGHQELWRDKLSREEIAKAVDEDRHRPTLWLWVTSKG